MTVEDYNFVISEKDKIIENISSELDRYKIKYYDCYKIFNRLIFFLKKYEIEDHQGLCEYLDKEYKKYIDPDYQPKQEAIQEKNSENINTNLDEDDQGDDKMEVTQEKVEEIFTKMKKGNYEKRCDIYIENEIKNINMNNEDNPDIEVKLEPEKALNIDVDTPKQENKESKTLLKQVKNNYYEFYNYILPEISNEDVHRSFKTINNNISSICKSKINTILQYYYIYDKFLQKYNGDCKKTKFQEFIEYDNYKYSLRYYEINKFYEKIKKCHDFIKYFKHKGFDYLGSKTYLKQIILKNVHINPDTQIFDLFCGSMSISYLLRKEYPENLIITNDVNSLLINFYNILKNNKVDLIEEIQNLNRLEILNDAKFLLNIINNLNESITKRVASYYIVNKLAFKGKLYFNKSNKLSAVWKKRDKILNIDVNHFSEFSEFLDNIDINNLNVLENTDYWLKRIKPGDMIILDPPYNFINNNFNNYEKTKFDVKEQEKLYNFVKDVVNKDCKILVFNNNTPFIRDLYKNFYIDIVSSKSKIDHKEKEELIIYN